MYSQWQSTLKTVRSKMEVLLIQTTWRDLAHGKHSVSNLASRSQNVSLPSPLVLFCFAKILALRVVHWFVNYELEKRFENARDMLEAIMGERQPEMQLFHGTSAANIDSSVPFANSRILVPSNISRILQGGFKIGGVGGHPMTNGAAMGYGIYLGAAAATSLGYAMGGNKIFACRGTFRFFPPYSLSTGDSHTWPYYQGTN